MDRKFYKRYAGRFTLICVLAFIVSSFLPVPGIFNALVAGAVSFYVGRLFVKDNGRAPEASEQNRYALAAFGFLILIVGILTATIVSLLPPAEKEAFFAPFHQVSLSAMIVGTILAVLMLWGAIHFGFGLGARLYMKSLEKKTVA